MKKTTRTIISELLGIPISLFGIYVMGCYMAKVLPFGIQASVDSTLFGVWAYTGFFYALVIIGYGIALAFQKPMKRYLKKLEKNGR